MQRIGAIAIIILENMYTDLELGNRLRLEMFGGMCKKRPVLLNIDHFWENQGRI